MKAVLISIRPEWVHKILTGEKTLEVRKTVPKINTPFKCFIYCTLSGSNELFREVFNADVAEWNKGKWADKKGNVVAEFICDSIFSIDVDFTIHDELPGNPVEEWLTWEDAPDVYEDATNIEKATCLSLKEIMAYIGCGSGCYCWHISDLKVYDKPKKLSEFYTFKECNSCKVSGYEANACIYDEDCKVPVIITRPPQSWCYAED